MMGWFGGVFGSRAPNDELVKCYWCGKEIPYQDLRAHIKKEHKK